VERDPIEKIVEDEDAEGSADIEYVDDWQGHYIVHRCEAKLIDEHGCCSGEEPFIISAIFEVEVYPHPAQEEIVSDEDGDASDEVGFDGVVVSLGDVDEAEGVHHGGEEEEEVSEVILPYLVGNAVHPSLDHFEASILIILPGLFFHVII